IGISTFGANKLTHVKIPKNVKSIGVAAFAENDITDVVIPENVEEIAESAFAFNKLKTVFILNDSLEFIDSGIILPNDRTLPATFAHNQDNPANLIMIGYTQSTAETYAEKYEHTFQDITASELYYKWTDNGDGTATITEYMGIDKEIDIPETLGGLTV